MKTLSDNMGRLHQEQTCTKGISKGHITGRGGFQLEGTDCKMEWKANMANT